MSLICIGRLTLLQHTRYGTLKLGVHFEGGNGDTAGTRVGRVERLEIEFKSAHTNVCAYDRLNIG